MIQEKALVDFLTAEKYRFLGSGLDQIAFLTPDGKYCYKFVIRENGVKMANVLINYFKENKWNNTPKIYGTDMIEIEGRSYFHYISEVLEENTYERRMEFAKKIKKCFNLYYDFIQWPDDRGGETSQSVFLQIKKEIRENQKYFESLNFNIKEMLPNIVGMCNLNQKKEFCLDIHSGNVMFRKDGTGVIVDPFVV